MSKIKNGGPAGNMSLRDALAISVRQAMGTWTPNFTPPVDSKNGHMATRPGNPAYEEAARRVRAAWAYDEADAMLAAREAKS